jgi:hypothetical protein
MQAKRLVNTDYIKEETKYLKEKFKYYKMPNAEVSKNKYVIARQIMKNVKNAVNDKTNRYGVFENVEEILKVTNETTIENRCFFEVIQGGPRRFYMDFDNSKPDARILEDIKDLMEETYKIKKEEIKLITCANSDMETKQSYHVISPNIYFPDATENKAFARLIPESDTTVYGTTLQHLRLAYNHKCDSNRIKLIEEGYEFKDTIITYQEEGKIVLGKVLSEEKRIKVQPKNLYLEIEYTELINKAKAYFEKNKIEWVYEYRSRYGNTIYTRRLKSSYCTICKREHKHDNTLKIVQEKNRVYIMCWKENKTKILIETLTRYDIYVHIQKLINKEVLLNMEEFNELREEQKTIYNESALREYERVRTLIVKAPMKIGKTKALKEHIEKYYKKENIIIVSFRKTFSSDIKSKFKDFELYSEINKRIDMKKNKKIIIQVESIHRIDLTTVKKENTVLILDEVESILEQFMNKQENIRESFNKFSWLIKNVENLIAMDANISGRTYNVLKYIRGIEGMHLHMNTYRNITETEWLLTHEYETWLDMLVRYMRIGKRLAIPTNSKRQAKIIYEIIKRNYIEEKDTNEILLLTAETSEKDKIKLFSNINEELKKYNIFIYTPTLTAGVSFETEHFDIVFGLFSNESCTVYTCDQMLGRIRNVKEKRYYICVREKLGIIPFTEDIKEIKSELNSELTKVYLGIEEEPKYAYKNYDDDTGETVYIEDAYYITWINNISIKNRHRNNFMSEMINLIKLRGGKCAVLEKIENEKKQKIKRIIQIENEKVVQQECEEIANSEEYEDIAFYEEIRDRINDKKDPVTKEEKLSLKKYNISKEFNIGLSEVTVDFIKKYVNEEARRKMRTIKSIGTNPSKYIKGEEAWIRSQPLDPTKEKRIKRYRMIVILMQYLSSCGYESIYDKKRITRKQLEENLEKNRNIMNKEDIFSIKYIKYVYKLCNKNQPIFKKDPVTLKQRMFVINTILKHMADIKIGPVVKDGNGKCKETGERNGDSFEIKLYDFSLELKEEIIKKEKEMNEKMNEYEIFEYA